MAREVERKLKALINSIDKKPSNPLPNEVRLISLKVGDLSFFAEIF